MHLIGRMCQLAGLFLLPLAIILELTDQLDRGDFGLSEMLVMMVFGWCLFQLGRYLEGRASKKNAS